MQHGTHAMSIYITQQSDNIKYKLMVAKPRQKGKLIVCVLEERKYNTKHEFCDCRIRRSSQCYSRDSDSYRMRNAYLLVFPHRSQLFLRYCSCTKSPLGTELAQVVDLDMLKLFTRGIFILSFGYVVTIFWKLEISLVSALAFSAICDQCISHLLRKSNPHSLKVLLQHGLAAFSRQSTES